MASAPLLVLRRTAGVADRHPPLSGSAPPTSRPSPAARRSAHVLLPASFTGRPLDHAGRDGWRPARCPPGGVGDQDIGIRRPETVAAPDRLSDSLYRDASWAAASKQIVMGLEPERVALDPLHPVVARRGTRPRDVPPAAPAAGQARGKAELVGTLSGFRFQASVAVGDPARLRGHADPGRHSSQLLFTQRWPRRCAACRGGSRPGPVMPPAPRRELYALLAWLFSGPQRAGAAVCTA